MQCAKYQEMSFPKKCECMSDPVEDTYPFLFFWLLTRQNTVVSVCSVTVLLNAKVFNFCSHNIRVISLITTKNNCSFPNFTTLTVWFSTWISLGFSGRQKAETWSLSVCYIKFLFQNIKVVLLILLKIFYLRCLCIVAYFQLPPSFLSCMLLCGSVSVNASSTA